MRNKQILFIALSFLFLISSLSFSPNPAFGLLLFSTGNPDGLIAAASRPLTGGKLEIESADDFILSAPANIQSATFTGLLVGATPADITQVVVEIYRVFSNDSDVGRTSGPPTFSTSQVPTRVNSPSDVEFVSRDSALSTLTFTTSLLIPDFTANNSVQNGGIHPIPNQTTGGNGPVVGMEVLFSVTFATPFSLPAGHYFFVPQVAVSPPGGDFYWLSAPKPIVAPGIPFSPDLQSWIRDQNLAPDWLRIGTDIVGGTTAPTFNAAFSLSEEPPTPAAVPTMNEWGLSLMTILLLLSGLYHFRKSDKGSTS
jgi:hypothetical protein